MKIISLFLSLVFVIFYSVTATAQEKGWGDDGLYYFKKADKFGFMDKSGLEVIAPKYHLTGQFYCGMAYFSMKEDGLKGFVNTAGVEVVAPKFIWVQDFSDDVVWVNTAASYSAPGKYAILDKAGKIVPTVINEYGNFKPFSEGFAAVQINGKWGYMDKAGKIVIEPQFDGADIFSEGLARILVGEDYGYIDKTGAIVITPQFYLPGNFSDGLADVQLYTEENGKTYVKRGFIDKTGAFVIVLSYSVGSEFSEGYAYVQDLDNDEYHYVDESGNIVIPPQKCDYAWQFSNGLAVITVNELCGFINKAGKWVVNPQYTLLWNFSKDGISYFQTDSAWGYIDSSGNVIYKTNKEL